MSDTDMFQLREAVQRHAVDAPDRIAVREVGPDTGRTLSYEALNERVNLLADHLRNYLPPGSVVFLCCPNSCDFHVAFLAVLEAGCSVFPFSPDAVEPEIISAATRAKSAAAIAPRVILSVLADHVPVLLSTEELLGDPTVHDVPTASDDSCDLLLQTSGTTGHPGIVRRPIHTVDSVARNMVEAIGFTGGDHVLSTLPLCHSYGLEHGLLAPLLAGSAAHVCRSFNVATIFHELGNSGITLFPAVPSIFEMLSCLADEGARFTSLRTAYSAGSVLPPRVYEGVSGKFGIRIGQVYGATEVGSVTFNDPHATGFDAGSAGFPMRGVSIRVVTSSGVPSLIGTEGQVQISAPSMFSGYVDGDGSEIDNGFFPTGDIGRLSGGGRLAITGRHKLLIDVGGLKVNPIEVEQLLLEHPLVAECVVIPVAMSDTVNRLKALIVPRHDDDPPAPDELSRFARARLTAYKVPRVFEIRRSLPRTATGKVLRHLIEA